MRDHSSELPESHRVINVARFDDPVSVITDTEAWLARDKYADMAGRGPMFAVTEQEPDGRWRILVTDEIQPQGCRDELARVCRLRAKDAEDAGDAEAERDWMAGAHRMEWEKTDDLRVRDCRFRIARADMVLRIGPDGPEPPRPSDPDPLPTRGKRSAPSRTLGFLIDPTAAIGLSEGILRLDLLRSAFAPSSVPEKVRRDSLRARRDYPGGVLLPPVFAVYEHVQGHWLPTAQACDSPQGARNQLAGRFAAMLPARIRQWHPHMRELPEELRHSMAARDGFLEPGAESLTERQLRALAKAAKRLERERLDDIEVLGHPYRVVRLECLMRLGPDGPEPPRPSDPDPDLPVSVQVAQDRANGLYDDEE
ncbi:DUF5954 family protein [Streptomyces sp. ACA25]|uniref:DUF5954 family protein n=1 Tax=Streptomyces sp. ACA25 TaxID=3022596 RepID=UPI0023077831|nr:DUF5954 family protein [Streptomyces sp. ACA25]MDB1088527.1 DUF5954 family protein [Streptomyces sp. ACA25]